MRAPAAISGSPLRAHNSNGGASSASAIVRARDAERLGQPAGPGAEQPHVGGAAAPMHRGEAFGRLQRADQHRARRTRALADEIHAPVDAVGAIHIGVAGRAEHHGVARGLAAIGMRGRIGVVIGLDLDDDPARAAEQQRRADQLGRDLVDAAVEEAFAEARHVRRLVTLIAFSAANRCTLRLKMR